MPSCRGNIPHKKHKEVVIDRNTVVVAIYSSVANGFGIPESLYWEAHAQGISPEGIERVVMDGIPSHTLLKSSEDALDFQDEDGFRREVLENLEVQGVEYQDGYLVLARENIDTQALQILQTLLTEKEINE